MISLKSLLLRYDFMIIYNIMYYMCAIEQGLRVRLFSIFVSTCVTRSLRNAALSLVVVHLPSTPVWEGKDSSSFTVNLTRRYNKPFVSTCIHLYPLTSTYIHLYPLVSTYIHLYPLISTCIHLYPLISSCIHLYPLISTCIHLSFNASELLVVLVIETWVAPIQQETMQQLFLSF